MSGGLDKRKSLDLNSWISLRLGVFRALSTRCCCPLRRSYCLFASWRSAKRGSPPKGRAYLDDRKLADRGSGILAERLDLDG